MDESLKHQAWIVLVAAVVLLTNLGGSALWDDDEPRNAQCAREMLDRGDWIVPRFNQELRFDKPVLLYWLMFGAYALLGPTELAARSCSALLAIGTSLLTYHLGRRLFRAEVGFWAGLIVVTSLLFVLAGRAATPDSTLIFFTTLSLFLLVRATIAEGDVSRDGRWSHYVPVYAAMGAAVLAKGPVGLVLPLGVLLADRVWRLQEDRVALRQWLHPRLWLQALWSLRPWVALLAVAVVALPWYVWVSVRTGGDWPAWFFGKHNLGRFLHPIEGHGGPVFYYLPAILVGFFPWSVLIAPTVLDLVRQLRRKAEWMAGYRLAVCWIGVYVGFFSFSGTKLPSYVLPAYPALALITAAFLVRWQQGQVDVGSLWMKTAIGVLGLVGLGMAVAMPVAARYLLPGENGLYLAGLVTLAGAAAAWVFLRRGRRPRVLAAMAATAVALAAVLFGVLSVQVSRHNNNRAIVACIHRYGPADYQLASFDYFSPSLVYYANHGVADCRDARQVREFFQQSRAPFLVANAAELDQIQCSLPADAVECLRQRRFLRSGEVVLIGRGACLAIGGVNSMRRVDGKIVELSDSVRPRVSASVLPAVR